MTLFNENEANRHGRWDMRRKKRSFSEFAYSLWLWLQQNGRTLKLQIISTNARLFQLKLFTCVSFSVCDCGNLLGLNQYQSVIFDEKTKFYLAWWVRVCVFLMDRMGKKVKLMQTQSSLS